MLDRGLGWQKLWGPGWKSLHLVMKFTEILLGHCSESFNSIPQKQHVTGYILFLLSQPPKLLFLPKPGTHHPCVGQKHLRNSGALQDLIQEVIAPTWQWLSKKEEESSLNFVKQRRVTKLLKHVQNHGSWHKNFVLIHFVVLLPIWSIVWWKSHSI